MQIRIQKYLSQAGICSRRKAEVYLQEGLIKVNGKTVTTLGTKVDPKKDKVTLSKELVEERKHMVYILLNKPKGYVSTCAQKDEKPVTDLIKTKTRVYPVGRLDKDTTGLLLLTNDGTVTYRLTHPKFHHEKEYLVTVTNITIPQLEKIKRGVKLDKTKTKTTTVTKVNRKQFKLILTEGRYHHIKRVVQKVGSKVVDLKRIRIENLTLKDLPKGKSRKLTKEEIKELKTRLDLPQ